MVKQEADRPHRSATRVSKHRSQISGFKELTLLDKTFSADKPSVPSPLPPSEPGHNLLAIPDRVYLHAAAIFQSSHVEKPAAHRLIKYGKRAGAAVPVAKDEASQRCAYELAFNTLQFQELLEDIMADSCLYLSQPMPDELMSLVAVMLYDLQDRKFLPRPSPASPGEEEVPEVREVEACLHRFKTKLAASLARCRIKHDLLTINCILPESVRERQERASALPLYAWVNTHTTSVGEVCEVLVRAGFSQVKSIGQLEGQAFCMDPLCQDLLVFPAQQRAELYRTRLLSQHALILQDKSCCVAPWTLRPLLVEDGDVLMVGFFSALTVAHVAAVAASVVSHTPAHTHTRSHGSVRVCVCVGDLQPAQREKLQEVLSNMGCKNVRLMAECFGSLGVCDPRLQSVQLILLKPQCSMSAVCNPVHHLLQENGDIDLLQDLSQGSISQTKLDALISQQRSDLQHALRFPKVQTVVYTTCSALAVENEEVVRRALAQAVEEGSKLQPYRVSALPLPQSGVCEDKGEGGVASFFRLEPSALSNGCFLAVLTRQREPEVVESAQEVLARAAAKGLLDGIQPHQPIKKEGRVRPSRKAAARTGQTAQTRPQISLSSQSRATALERQEMKASSSVPTVTQQRSNSTLSLGGKAKNSRRRLPPSFPSKVGSTLNPSSLSSPPQKNVPLTSISASSTKEHGVRAPVRTSSVPPPPLAPPKGRQGVLRPVALTLPSVMFPADSSPSFCVSRATPPARPIPALSYLQWRSSMPRPAGATATVLLSCSSGNLDSSRSSMVKHPRPWF